MSPELHNWRNAASAPGYPRSRRRRIPKPCPCGCGQLGLCEAHKARLAAVREELAAASSRKCASVGNKRRKRALAPRCCNRACGQPRIPPDAFCPDCQADGWTEDTA